MTDRDGPVPRPDEPGTLLPEDSLLTLEEYLEMQQAVGNEHRFRILSYLVDDGAHSANELQDALDIQSNTLHHHLDVLVDVGLVENRKRSEPTSSGLYSYYPLLFPLVVSLQQVKPCLNRVGAVSKLHFNHFILKLQWLEL